MVKQEMTPSLWWGQEVLNIEAAWLEQKFTPEGRGLNERSGLLVEGEAYKGTRWDPPQLWNLRFTTMRNIFAKCG